MEVEAGGGEDGVDPITVLPLEVIAAHAVLGLQMADDRLDHGPSFHLPLYGSGGASDLAGDPDPELFRVAVTLVTLIDVNALGLDAGQLGEVGDDGTQRMAVEPAAIAPRLSA
jgi:hypothetical protein